MPKKPRIPGSYVQSMKRCGYSDSRIEEYWNRTEWGDFVTGDILFIPDMDIIDWGQVWRNGMDEFYGNVRTLSYHKFLVVGENEYDYSSKGLENSDIQLVLLDGIHPENIMYEEAKHFNEENPHIRIVLPAVVGLENDYYASTERLIMANKDDLYGRYSRVMGHIQAKYQSLFLKVQKSSYAYGRERMNTLNLPKKNHSDFDAHEP